MRVENGDGRPHWGKWERVRASTVFLGLDFSLRHHQAGDSLAILRFGNQWQVATVTGPNWVAALRDEIISPGGSGAASRRRHCVLTIDASLSRPAMPEYWQRGCEEALNKCRGVNISWQGQSFQKVQDLIGQLPLQGPAKRVLLETHPQSNYPSNIRRDRSACDQFLRQVFTTLTAQQVPETFPAANQSHAQHAVAAALVSIAYGRFRSSDITAAQDNLATVIDHDGCFWLLDLASLGSATAAGTQPN